MNKKTEYIFERVMLILIIFSFLLLVTVVSLESKQMSEEQIEMTKQFEGLHKIREDGLIESYPDAARGWDLATIGYGSTAGVYRGMVITKQQADAMFLRDKIKKENYVNRKIYRELNQCQFDACVDHVYNVGSIYGKLLLYIQSKQDTLASDMFRKYVFANGVKLRGLEIRANYRAELFIAECDRCET